MATRKKSAKRTVRTAERQSRETGNPADKIMKILNRLVPDDQIVILQKVNTAVREQQVQMINDLKGALSTAESTLAEFTKVVPGADAKVIAIKESVTKQVKATNSKVEKDKTKEDKEQKEEKKNFE